MSPAGEAFSDAEAAERAADMLGALASQSRFSQGVDWAVGAYESAGQTTFYATSNEGMGYVPEGVWWDPAVRHAFEFEASSGLLLPWRGLENPARIIADHYLMLRSKIKNLRLLTIMGTQPVGRHVVRFKSSVGAGSSSEAAGRSGRRRTEAAESVSTGRRAANAVHRIESADPGRATEVLDRIPIHRRWEAGLSLTAAAFQTAFAPSVLESGSGVLQARGVLEGVLGRLRAGSARADLAVELLGQVERMRDECAARAQSYRVPDHRLEQLALHVRPGAWGDVAPPGEAFACIGPFWAARVASMLTTLLRSSAGDEYLTQEQMADLAYEHLCVVESSAQTRSDLAVFASEAGAA